VLKVFGFSFCSEVMWIIYVMPQVAIHRKNNARKRRFDARFEHL